MNSYSILLHNIGQGIHIHQVKLVIKIELTTVTLQNIYKINLDEQIKNKKKLYYLPDFGL